MKILVVGLGLIGGSFCKGISEYTDHMVYGYDANQAVVAAALADGAIAGAATENDFSDFDMLLLCLHPDVEIAFVTEYVSRLRAGAILADACGVKGVMVEPLTRLAASYGVRFVGAHPMAGKEHSGFDFSDSSIFLGANFIVTPISETDKQAVLEVKTLAKEIGFGHLVETTPSLHDSIIAYTSQLAHVVSSAYVKSPTLQREMGFSAGSFQDMTRIATLNESMWTSLFFANRECLLYELDQLLQHLQAYRDALAAGDRDAMCALLKAGRLLKEENIRLRTREKE